MTNSTPDIREEAPADLAYIYALTKLAFQGKPYAGGDEQDLIDKLRASGRLVLSLVAIVDSTIVGHIAFSNASLSNDTAPWFALGPVSVLPTHQHTGIGSKLINKGLADIEQRGALGCILTGNPDYYQRFGFEFAPDNVPDNESELHFMLKTFTTTQPHGKFSFDPAFYESD